MPPHKHLPTAPPTDTERLVETTIDAMPIYQGRVISLRKDRVNLSTGIEGTREVVTHPGGAVVLPILDDGRIIFVQQYRYALGHTLLELPAGKVDPGEDPLTTVQRELGEETGFTAQHWTSLGAIYTSPGFCNEKLWLYKAHGLSPMDVHIEDAHELIDVFTLSLSEAHQLIRDGHIVDAKTMSALLIGFGLG
jgi:ADP-ribose pyrophosphatase